MVRCLTLPAAGSFISLAAGLMFGIAAFVGAYQMTKNDKDIWVSMGKSLFLFLKVIYKIQYVYIYNVFK